MPFTLVHPAFVLPIYTRIKSYCIPVGLIAGSLVPDYDIIFRFTETRHHLFAFNLRSIFGILTPLSFITVFFYTYILRDFMMQRCPPLLQQIAVQLPAFPFRSNRKEYILLFLNIVGAIYLHLFLDMISHYDAWSIMQYVKYRISGNEILLNFTYWGSMYIPQLIFMLWGLYILYINCKDYLVYFSWKDFFSKRMLGYYIIAHVIALIKISLSGIKAEFGIDVIIISLFCGYTLAFAILAILYFIRKKFLYDYL